MNFLRRNIRFFVSVVVAFALFYTAVRLRSSFEYDVKTYTMLFNFAFLILVFDVIIKFVNDIMNKEFLNETFLILISTTIAYFFQMHAEAFCVLLLYRIGNMISEMSVDISKESLSEVMDIKPEFARRENGDKVKPEEIAVGETIVVEKGEKIPLDGTLLSDSAVLDTQSLTGETDNYNLVSGNRILNGSINIGDTIKISVTKPYSESTVARILSLTEDPSIKKSKSYNFITKFISYYTPFVLIIAFSMAVLVPLMYKDSFEPWVFQALTFIVAACPSALTIALPVAYFAGLACANKNNILIKGSQYLEAFSFAKKMIFDKTGTLTNGKEIKENVPSTIETLKKRGIEKLYMLSGDKPEIVEDIAGKAGIDEYRSELLPDQKLVYLQEIMEETQQDAEKNHKLFAMDVPKVVYVGDGVNDAPALSKADIGVAMGTFGTDAAIEAADVVIMGDDVSKILTTMDISKHTRKIAMQNIAIAIAIKVGVLVWALLRQVTMTKVLTADIVVSVITIINSVRAYSIGRRPRVKKPKKKKEEAKAVTA
jgi:cation transport ATPase